MVIGSYRRYEGGKEVGKEGGSDILSAHPASCLWDAKFLFQQVQGCNGIANL